MDIVNTKLGTDLKAAIFILLLLLSLLLLLLLLLSGIYSAHTY